MRLHRFHLEGEKIAEAKPSDRFLVENKAVIHQWRDVFRYTVGSQVLVFDDSRTECLAMVEEISDYKATLVILEVKAKEVPKKEAKTKTSLKKRGADKKPEVWLLQSMVKGDNFEWIVEKTTEVGVNHVIPVVSDRTIKKGVNLERARKIAVEASEQSGRLSVPAVEDIVELKNAIQSFKTVTGGTVVVCMQGGKSIDKVLPKKIVGDVALLVGPEGGWSPTEVEYFKKSKFPFLILGEHVLRAETAAVCGVFSIVQHIG